MHSFTVKNMFKQNSKELLLAIILVAVLFFAADVLGDFVADPTGEALISLEIMLLAMAILILPSLLGTIPTGFLIGKKTQDVKTAIFISGLGAAIAGIVIMLLALVEMMLMPDALWQEQFAQLSELGVDFFGSMTIADFKAFTMFSVGLASVFLAVFNFAIGLAGGYIGRAIALKGKGQTQPKAKISAKVPLAKKPGKFSSA